MNRELLNGIIAALEGQASANFAASDVNEAAISAILKEAGLSENPTARELRNNEAAIFSLIEEAVDEILPKKLENLLGAYAEVRTFARDAEVVFNIEKIGKNRAKLTISKGARGGIYRAARLDSKYFSPETTIQTVAVYVTLEELILGTMSLAELYANILEGFQEVIYKETFNALATGAPAAGYNRIYKDIEGSDDSKVNGNIVVAKSALSAAIDEVMPYVKQYGVPTIFGSYAAVNGLYNPLAGGSAGHINDQDSMDIRNYGYVQMYKGVRVVELPNYLVDNSNNDWFYDPSYVFVIPSGIKPVKIALKGELQIQRNAHAVGSEKWEAHKLIGVGLAMANNYAVIQVK
jgi:hypothetical protein